MAVVADIACNVSIETWLPIYPGAEDVSVQYNFIRARGLGTTFMILHTADSVEKVEDFYRQNIAALVNKGTPRGMGSTDFNVQKDADNGGSLIFLFSHCIL